MNGIRPFRAKWKAALFIVSLMFGVIRALDAQQTQLGLTINYLPGAKTSGDPAGTFQINLYNYGSVIASNVVVTVDPDPNLAISGHSAARGPQPLSAAARLGGCLRSLPAAWVSQTSIWCTNRQTSKVS